MVRGKKGPAGLLKPDVGLSVRGPGNCDRTHVVRSRVRGRGSGSRDRMCSSRDSFIRGGDFRLLTKDRFQVIS